MKPADRYQIHQSIVNRQWGILDRMTTNSIGKAGFRYIVEDLRSQKQARAVKAALVEAYEAGVSAVKWGEVIV